MNIQSLLEGAGHYNFSPEANKLVSKWEKSGLLEGLKSDTDRNNMALMLENQAKQIVTEASQTGTGASFTAGAGEQWAGVALPLVRRIFGEISAKEFVSVQPMSLPSGLVFYLDFKYGTTKNAFTQGDSIYSATEDQEDTDLTKGLYGAGRFGYSINNVTETGKTAATVTTASWADVFYAAELSASVATGAVKKLNFDFSGFTKPNFDFEGVRSFQLSGSGLVSYLPTYNTPSGSTGVNFFVSASSHSAVTGSQFQIDYHLQPAMNSRGDFEDTIPAAATSTQAIPEINVNMRSANVTAKTRKLKAQWSPEFSQDLKAYHNIDAEAELTAMLSQYVSMEIDLEILDMLIQNAATTDAWSARIAYEVANGTVSSAATNGQAYVQGTWFQTLGTKLQKVSNEIHRKTLRGGANFLVCSPTVSTILESIPGFAADSPGDKNTYAMGVQKIGAINNRYTVYKNPYMVENTILLGFKGSQFLETGAVYAPYIPLMLTPLVYDPVSFTPRKGIMTRYAKKMVRNDFYGTVRVADLDRI
jgi:hypothetical protein